MNIALGNAPVGDCAQFDANGDGSVAVNGLIAAVAAVLDGCPTPRRPTPRATPDADSPATLVIEQGAGNEFVTGRAYGFDLADLRPGNIRFALRGAADRGPSGLAGRGCGCRRRSSTSMATPCATAPAGA
ncbi:MAG: hypothetical protein U0802_13675 [Candidatus Binatia bacterium]